MRKAAWVVALALTVASSAVQAEEHCCPCPHREAEPAPAKKKDLNFGLPVAGGPNADKAEPIELNRDYRLNHHQKKGAKDYFYLKLKPGAEITLGLKALDKGIDLSSGRPRETSKPYAGVELQDPEGERLAALSIDGEPRRLRRSAYQVVRPGRYVLAVGSDTGDMHKDQTVFKVSLVPMDLDCPEGATGEIDVDAAEPQRNCLGGGDEQDTFRFRARKREIYRIDAAMPEGTVADLRAKLTYRNRLKKTKTVAEASGSGGRVALESVRMPQDGDYVLEVSLAKALAENVPYTLTLIKTSGR
ncbi:MAG TPA: hypothetical protein VLJ37_07210 [bacterium]|nr:hypothetical protein [bacterium]